VSRFFFEEGGMGTWEVEFGMGVSVFEVVAIGDIGDFEMWEWVSCTFGIVKNGAGGVSNSL